MRTRTICHKDAIRLLEDGKPHRLKLWKLSTGDILIYPDAVCIGAFRRKALHRVVLLASRQVRAFRDICLFNIDDMNIYL